MRDLGPVLSRALAGDHRMVFLAGPRQVGKTTLAKHLLAERGTPELYFNWDVERQRRAIVKDPSDFFRAALPEHPAAPPRRRSHAARGRGGAR